MQHRAFDKPQLMHFSQAWIDKEITAIPDKRERIRKMILFVICANDYLIEECYQLALQCREISIEIGAKDSELAARVFLAFTKVHKGNIEEGANEIMALEDEVAALPTSEVSSVIRQGYAFFYWSIGKRDKAFSYAYEMLKYSTETRGIWFGWTNYMLGVFHFDMKDYDASLEYFHQAEAEGRQHNELYGMARTNAGIGSIYLVRDQPEKALQYVHASLEGFRRMGHKTGESRALNDLGMVSMRLGIPREAEQCFREALALRRQLAYVPGIITTEMELAGLLISEGSFAEAETLLHSALQLSTQFRSKLKIAKTHKLLAELYKKKQEPWQALEHLESYFRAHADVEGEEASNRLKRLQQNFATEKSKQEAEIHRLKNVELKKAYDEIGEKNKNILDSIHYAQRIQRALLASDKLLDRQLGEYFVLYQPKDIVSGDFYWAAERNGNFFLAAADCTGHGVPGAFMSLLNSSYLNEAVADKNLLEPAEILGEVRHLLVAALNPEGSIEETRDGMDVTLLAYDATSRKLSFACANNPLILARNGELQIFGPDKFPVGIYPDYENRPFTPHQIQLQENDRIYLFTDGYADQFGGALGKKFKFRNLRELLQKIHQLPMAEQKNILLEKHLAWKGNLEQVDDVLIIGFKIR
jgi:serine phosphatase RsbU (regulator of sigma subunit)